MTHSKQTLLNREMFIEALRYMGEEDLVYLNRMVVERLKLLSQAKSTAQLAQFAKGDRVYFTTREGETLQGIIHKLNTKTATIKTDDKRSWFVAPSLLRKVETLALPASSVAL